ncbi:MAG TPA: hypothetical protein VI076_08740 [Actinopolymorphaceae bacterium]
MTATAVGDHVRRRPVVTVPTTPAPPASPAPSPDSLPPHSPDPLRVPSTVTSFVAPPATSTPAEASAVVTHGFVTRGLVHVPGYGWVDWPTELLDAQARYLTFVHRPARAGLGRRMRRGFRATAIEAVCVFCGREWLCPEAAWAQKWLRPGSRRGGRRGGRHRKLPTRPGKRRGS